MDLLTSSNSCSCFEKVPFICVPMRSNRKVLAARSVFKTSLVFLLSSSFCVLCNVLCCHVLLCVCAHRPEDLRLHPGPNHSVSKTFMKLSRSFGESHVGFYKPLTHSACGHFVLFFLHVRVYLYQGYGRISSKL